jgi:2,3-bisphosphoglycerate-dependent phosphoglycerate mutase
VTRLIFETHSTTADNEAGLATGWRGGALSALGREQAQALGARRREVDVVIASDLARTIETAVIAFAGSGVAIHLDPRLRECDYGELTGHPTVEVHSARLAHLDVPYPGGESYRDVVTRVEAFLHDVDARWPDATVLVIGHSATRYALDHLLAGADLATVLAEPGVWQPGWEYVLGAGAERSSRSGATSVAGMTKAGGGPAFIHECLVAGEGFEPPTFGL